MGCLKLTYYKSNLFEKVTYSDLKITIRSYAETYRYGFNSMEKDDEVSGAGNSYTSEYWQYDSRLGRRWNTDPVVKEHESPYAAFANNPIWFIDPSGTDTINGNKALPAIKELNNLAKSIENAKVDIVDLIDNRNEIRKKLDNIETKQDYSELLNDVNPFKSPWHKAVDKNVSLNKNLISALKIYYVYMEVEINKAISAVNDDIDNYNYKLLELNLEFRTMDEDDNLFVSNKYGTAFYEQNKTEQKAFLRVTIDKDIYRFGTINSSTKAFIFNLQSINKISPTTVFL